MPLIYIASVTPGTEYFFIFALMISSNISQDGAPLATVTARNRSGMKNNNSILHMECRKLVVLQSKTDRLFQGVCFSRFSRFGRG